MSRPNFFVIQSGVEGWDGLINANFTIAGSGPFPLAVYANPGALPAANLNDRCLAVVFDNIVSNDYVLALSNGFVWRLIGVRGTAVADLSGGASLSDVINKVNELLARLRGAGVLKT